MQPLRKADRTEVGGYRLLGRLGEGGMGTVYLAEDAGGTRVALKVIRDHLLDEPEFRSRFRGEVERVKNVPPFCTAEVLDADPDHEPPYLVVEYVDGPNLSEIVNESGPLSATALHSLGLGMATALTAIHNSGVIHRDLKPANVLLPRGGVKVIDFGLARDTGAGSSQMTKSDQVMGTIPYISPERLAVSGAEITTASDVFSWGAVMVYAATGRTPFGADTPATTAIRILTEEPNLDGVAEPLRAIVARALQKDPSARPSARDLLDQLVSLGATRNVPTEVLRPAEAAQAMEPSVSFLDGALHDPGATGAYTVRRREWRRAWVAAAIGVVSALAVAGVVLATTVLGDPGSHASGLPPTPTPTAGLPSDSPSPSPSPSPSASPLPQMAVPDGWLTTIPDDPLTEGLYWAAGSGAAGGCAFGPGGLQVTAKLAYQCARASGVAQQDVGLAVNVQLQTRDACGALWFRFTPKTGGYALRVCYDGVYLDEYRPNPANSRATWQRTNLRVFPFAQSQVLAVGRVIRVGAVFDGDHVKVYVDGAFQGEYASVRLDTGVPTLGMLQAKSTATAPAVLFSHVTLLSPPIGLASPSPSVSPAASPSASPSASVSPSRSPSSSPSGTRKPIP